MQTLWVIGLVVWIAVGVALLAVMAYSFPLVKEVRTFLNRSNELIARTNERIDPVMDRIEDIVEDAGEMSASLRKDVSEIGGAVDEGSRSARRIARIAENRVTEIDALLEVAQEEAESSFLSAASLLGGVRSLRDRLFGER